MNEDPTLKAHALDLAVREAGGDEAYQELIRTAPSYTAPEDRKNYLEWLENPRTHVAAVQALKADRDKKQQHAAMLTPTTATEYAALERRALAGDEAAIAAVRAFDPNSLKIGPR